MFVVILTTVLSVPPVQTPEPYGTPAMVVVFRDRPCRFYTRHFGNRFDGRWTLCVEQSFHPKILPNDHIVQIEATPVNNLEEFNDYWYRLRPGARVKIVVHRGLNRIEVMHTVTEQKP